MLPEIEPEHEADPQDKNEAEVENYIQDVLRSCSFGIKTDFYFLAGQKGGNV